jgi:hypothetical protein
MGLSADRASGSDADESFVGLSPEGLVLRGVNLSAPVSAATLSVPLPDPGAGPASAAPAAAAAPAVAAAAAAAVVVGVRQAGAGAGARAGAEAGAEAAMGADGRAKGGWLMQRALSGELLGAPAGGAGVTWAPVSQAPRGDLSGVGAVWLRTHFRTPAGHGMVPPPVCLLPLAHCRLSCRKPATPAAVVRLWFARCGSTRDKGFSLHSRVSLAQRHPFTIRPFGRWMGSARPWTLWRGQATA